MKMKYPPCGALCEVCRDFRKKRCKGCVETGGEPWFLNAFTRFKVCPIYECAARRKLSKCMDCSEFPCKKFLEWYNPKIGFFRSSLARVGSLFLRIVCGSLWGWGGG